MQKLGFPSTKRFDQLKSLTGSISGNPKPASALSSRNSSDSISNGSFTNLKLTAEKLVKEQASVKSDLDMANCKLKKSVEHIRELEEKLQTAFNENAKLKVKQNEDRKFWDGLESKFLMTKTLCDQLTESLQHLAGQVQDAEKDKKFFEEKLSSSSIAFDSLSQQMDGLSLKLEASEETLKTCQKDLEDLRIEKEERDKIYKDEQCKAVNVINEKDAMIKNFEMTLAANKNATEDLNLKLAEAHREMRLKEDRISHLVTAQDNLEREKNDTKVMVDDLNSQLVTSLQEVKRLEKLVHMLAGKLAELDKENLNFLDKFDRLNSLHECCVKLAEQERDLAAKCAKKMYDQLHDNYACISSEKDTYQLHILELKNKMIDLQKYQDSVQAQLLDECRLSKEKIERLDFEAETLASNKAETELLNSELEGRIESLLEEARRLEDKMQGLLLKISTLETENHDNTENFKEEIKKKEEEIDNLLKVNSKHEQQVDSKEKEVEQLQNALDEKEQLILEYKDKEKQLEDQTTENQKLLTAAESRLVEAKKQHDLILESKQLELSRHLKEISQRNDQAINDIRKKYEVEKLEVVNNEKQKAEKTIQEMEKEYERKLAESREESRQHVTHIQEEHATLVNKCKQEQASKEQKIKADHCEELKRLLLQAENELRERTTQLRTEHEVQMKASKCQYEDECRKLHEELDLQKTKEERQRALLQLQWKVMSDKPQEDPEVNSKKTFRAIPSSKLRNPSGGKRGHRALISPENQEEDSPSLEEVETPVSKALKKVENTNAGSVTSGPKHHKKVTRREYEVETSNGGRTITKRRKTRSTVMFEDPRTKNRNTPKATPRNFVKGVKGGSHPHPSNIGDLFSEGSLNPYADDPYAFD